MISLAYCLSGEWNKDYSTSELASMDESSLRYRFFMGDIEFRVDEATFDAPWGWVPILDFGVGLLRAVISLPESGEAVFEFTESEAEIRFVMKGSAIEIGATYADSTALTPYVEMQQAAEAFAVSVLDQVETSYPVICSNKAYLSIKMQAIGG